MGGDRGHRLPAVVADPQRARGAAGRARSPGPTCKASCIDTSPDDLAVARRALSLLDLTNLDDNCTAADVDVLCAKAIESVVAAVCVWPEFVAQAVEALLGRPVRIATVVNFPDGGEEIGPVLAQAGQALAHGAQEIDMVLPYRALLDGRPDQAGRMVAAVSAIVERPRRRLKVILETGELPDQAAVASAARLAIDAGADFIKTSTGKTPVSATPEAVGTMLSVIRAAGRPVGIKPSGGIRTFADAKGYLEQVDGVMGAGWATPATFRFGASGLRDALVAVIEGRSGAHDAAPGSSY